MNIIIINIILFVSRITIYAFKVIIIITIIFYELCYHCHHHNFECSHYCQSSVTICTVGFGDLSPSTDGGRIFTIFFALIGCTLSVKGFSEVVRFPIVLKLKRNEMNVSVQFEYFINAFF